MRLHFRKNLGTADRIIRFIIGVLLLGLVAADNITGGWAAIVTVFVVFQFVEAYFAY